jgi:DNA repair protein RadD
MLGLRDYQQQAVAAGIAAIRKKVNGVIVCPSGGGKSWVAAGIAAALDGPTLVLQPTKEILEQNVAKMATAGETDIGIWSASCGSKELGRITYATIGSVMNYTDQFRHFQRIIVDECHLCGSEEDKEGNAGQYRTLFKKLGVPWIGLTATPWRLRSYTRKDTAEQVAESRILTRTRPRIFDRFLHITQVGDLFGRGYLCPCKQIAVDDGYDQGLIKGNSTGAGFDDESLIDYHDQVKLIDRVAIHIGIMPHKSIVVFTQFRAESAALLERLASTGIAAAEVSGETPKAEREAILTAFKAGDIQVVTNVAVLGVGFDFPALECVVLAAPTRSVGRFYQQLGRVLRPSPGKVQGVVYDFCGNLKRFGRIETFQIVDDAGRREPKWRLCSSAGWQTDINVAEGAGEQVARPASGEDPALVADMVCPFGKYQPTQTKLRDIPLPYIRYMAMKMRQGPWKNRFAIEYHRRRTLK